MNSRERTAKKQLGRPEKADRVRSAIRANWRTHSDREIAAMVGVSNRTVGNHRRILAKTGEILHRLKSTHPTQACLYEVCTSAIEPSPENDKLYDPIRHDDQEFQKLVEDIKVNGILERIHVTGDGYIISGHRRHAAAVYLELDRIPVHIRSDVWRSKDLDRFLQLLASHNNQRVKTTAEAIREGVVNMDEQPWHRLCDYRRDASAVDGAQVITLKGEKKRSAIVQKISLKKAIIQIVNSNKKDWPLSDRKIFYFLLNITGLLRNDVRKTPFLNNDDCYDDVTDMVTRMRLDGSIPFDCITDETRPVIQWNTHRSVGTFIDKELEDLFSEYWRDLQQSQINHVELLGEKNTVATSLERIAEKYTIPMTSGRGYSSLPPRKDMVDRFRESGREKLIVIVVSDFDPEGQDIPNSFGLSLRDDFGLSSDELIIIKAALTHNQTQTLNLHEGQLAKEESARYKRFVSEFGERCWELEAVPTDTLREIVEDTIRGEIDLDAFDRELEKHEEEQEELDQHRQRVRDVLLEMDFSEDDNDDD